MTMHSLCTDHLAPETRAWVAQVRDQFDLDAHHHRLLLLAAQAFDRAEQARVILARDGLVTCTDQGGLKAHPAVAIERDARVAFARLLRELDLDMTSEADAPRPPSLRSNRG
jgi:phage terminase small subunit